MIVWDPAQAFSYFIFLTFYVYMGTRLMYAPIKQHSQGLSHIRLQVCKLQNRYVAAAYFFNSFCIYQALLFISIIILSYCKSQQEYLGNSLLFIIIIMYAKQIVLQFKINIIMCIMKIHVQAVRPSYTSIIWQQLPCIAT